MHGPESTVYLVRARVNLFLSQLFVRVLGVSLFHESRQSSSSQSKRSHINFVESGLLENNFVLSILCVTHNALMSQICHLRLRFCILYRQKSHILAYLPYYYIQVYVTG